MSGKKLDRSKACNNISISMDTGSSFIYVISAPNGLIKVGISFDPTKRLRTLATGSPVPLTLAYVFHVKKRALSLEKEIHEKMAASRSHGEWFRMPADEAAQIIKDIPQMQRWAEKAKCHA